MQNSDNTTPLRAPKRWDTLGILLGHLFAKHVPAEKYKPVNTVRYNNNGWLALKAIAYHEIAMAMVLLSVGVSLLLLMINYKTLAGAISYVSEPLYDASKISPWGILSLMIPLLISLGFFMFALQQHTEKGTRQLGRLFGNFALRLLCKTELFSDTNSLLFSSDKYQRKVREDMLAWREASYTKDLHDLICDRLETCATEQVALEDIRSLASTRKLAVKSRQLKALFICAKALGTLGKNDDSPDKLRKALLKWALPANVGTPPTPSPVRGLVAST